MSGISSLLPGGSDGSQVFAHGLYDPPTPNPEPCTDTHSSIQEQPNWCGSSGGYRSAFVDQPECNERANRITVREE